MPGAPGLPARHGPWGAGRAGRPRLLQAQSTLLRHLARTRLGLVSVPRHQECTHSEPSLAPVDRACTRLGAIPGPRVLPDRACVRRGTVPVLRKMSRTTPTLGRTCKGSDRDLFRPGPAARPGSADRPVGSPVRGLVQLPARVGWEGSRRSKAQASRIPRPVGRGPVQGRLEQGARSGRHRAGEPVGPDRAAGARRERCRGWQELGSAGWVAAGWRARSRGPRRVAATRGTRPKGLRYRPGSGFATGRSSRGACPWSATTSWRAAASGPPRTGPRHPCRRSATATAYGPATGSKGVRPAACPDPSARRAR